MSKSIADLHPILQPLCREFLIKCKDAKLDARIIFTYRSDEEQDKLYAQGRTVKGVRVTNLKGGESKHNFSINEEPASKAFDFGVFTSDGDYITNGADWRYEKAGKIGEALGLRWGGRWRSPFDPSHLELRETT